jgi:hypothetical protein
MITNLGLKLLQGFKNVFFSIVIVKLFRSIAIDGISCSCGVSVWYCDAYIFLKVFYALIHLKIHEIYCALKLLKKINLIFFKILTTANSKID